MFFLEKNLNLILLLRKYKLSAIKKIAVPLKSIWDNRRIGSKRQPWKIRIPPHSNPIEEKKES